MTAGRLFGTFSAGRAMPACVATERDDKGKPIPGTEHVVWGDVNFYQAEGAAAGAGE